MKCTLYYLLLLLPMTMCVGCVEIKFSDGEPSEKKHEKVEVAGSGSSLISFQRPPMSMEKPTREPKRTVQARDLVEVKAFQPAKQNAPQPPTADEIADAVKKKISPFIERVEKLNSRVTELDELVAKLIEAARLSESQSRRSEAELRAELADLKSSMTKLKDEMTKEREPDLVTKKLAQTLDMLTEHVTQLNRRVNLLTAPSPPAEPKTEIKPKPESKSVSEKKSLSWVTATVMPPCRRGLVTVEINPEGGTQAFTCPHCRGATFHATVLSTSPLRVQTARP